MTTRLPLLALLLGACAHPDDPAEGWSLVGLYDGGGITREATAPDPGWAWRPAPGMTRACGATRTPFGMGRTEADALLTGQTSSLVVLLYRQQTEPEPSSDPSDPTTTRGDHLTRDDVQLMMRSRCDGGGVRQKDVRLEPAVMPRALRIHVDEALPEAELVQSLAVTACMEHRLQRGWIGGDDEAVEEALLMKPAVEDADRAFVGQGARWPALWGAPDVCLLSTPPPGVTRLPSAASPTLHPADVWGGTLRACTDQESWQASPDHGSLLAPLSLRGAVATQNPEPALWRDLSLEPVGNDELAIYLDDERVAVRPIRRPVGGIPAAASPDDASAEGDDPADAPRSPSSHLTDVMAEVPLYYPTFEVTSAVDEWVTGGEAATVVHHYALLVVPAWQLQEGCLTDDEAGALDAVGAPYPERPVQADPVGELLSDPDRLQVLYKGRAGWHQLHPSATSLATQLLCGSSPDGAASAANSTDNTCEDLVLKLSRKTRWGSPVNIEASRRPLAALSPAPPTPAEIQRVNRAVEESLVVMGGAVLLLFAAFGLRRLPELWAPQPELRGERWTERPPEDGP